MPAIGGTQGVVESLRDDSGETTSHRVFTGEITAVSLPGLLTQIGAYRTALEGIALGTVAKESWGEDTVVSNATPSNGAAREYKLLVQYQGVTTERPFTLTIGTIDPSVIVRLPGGGDAVAFEDANGASAEVQAWVTAFEAMAKSPEDETEDVVVVGMRTVGRNT